MKRIYQITLVIFIIALAMAGCNPAADVTPIPTISFDASGNSEVNQVKASAVVVPSLETRLSFVIPGLVENVTVEEGDTVKTGETLVTLDTTELEYELIAAESSLVSAEIDAQIQRQRRKKFNFDTFSFVYVSPPGEKILIADSKVEEIRSTLEIVKASISQRTLTAPIDGTVVKVDVSPGENVQPSQRVIVIVDLKNLQIETTDLSELNISTVKIGQPATVFVEALNEEFPGKVVSISPISNTLGGDVVFKVTIQLDEQPGDLLWGMSADVEINVE